MTQTSTPAAQATIPADWRREHDKYGRSAYMLWGTRADGTWGTVAVLVKLPKAWTEKYETTHFVTDRRPGHPLGKSTRHFVGRAAAKAFAETLVGQPVGEPIGD